MNKRRYLKIYYVVLWFSEWGVYEIYIKVKSPWTYLYRAVDSERNNINFHLSKLMIQHKRKSLKKIESRTEPVVEVDTQSQKRN